MSTNVIHDPRQEAGLLVPPGSWRISDESTLEFQMRGLGRGLRGGFASFRGRLSHQPGDAVLASGAVEVASLRTEGERSAEQLLGADFLDAAHNPQISFRSRRIIPSDDGHFDVPGSLTIKGVARELSFDAVHLPRAPADGDDVIRLLLTGTVDRAAYGLRAPAGAGLFGLFVSSRVRIRAMIVAVRDERLPDADEDEARGAREDDGERILVRA